MRKTYEIWWSMGGWNLLTEEPVTGACRVGCENIASYDDLEAAVSEASDIENLTYWLSRHGPGVAVVLTHHVGQKGKVRGGKRRGGPYSPPDDAERVSIIARAKLLCETDEDEADGIAAFSG